MPDTYEEVTAEELAELEISWGWTDENMELFSRQYDEEISLDIPW